MVEKKFKHTDLGTIPKEWRIVKLEDFCTLKARIGWQGLTTAEYLSNGEYYLITGTDFKNGYIDWGNCVFVEKIRFDQDPNIQIKQGDVLITKDGTIGKVAYIDKLHKSTTLNSGVFVLRTNDNTIYSRYLYYILMSFYFDDFIRKITAGSTITHLYQKDFVHFSFVLPSLPEQKAIAETLTHTDEWIESLEKLIAKKRLIKQGAMQQLLTPKKDWKEFEFNKKIWFQEGPGLRNWQFTKLGIKVINVTNLENGYLNLSRTDRFISLDEYQKMYKHFLIDEGDIVVASSGNSYGKVSIVRKQDLPLLMNTSVIRFKPLSGVSYLFLLIFLKSNFFKSQIDLLITGGAQPNFGPAHLNKIKIWLPKDIKQQNHIANILSDMDSEIEALEQKLSKAKQIKQGMMQELLTGKIRLIDSNSKQEKSKFKK